VSRSELQCVRIHPLAIPMRQKFKHAAAERDTADPIVVSVELGSGVIGYGETLARPYVTGETVASVIEDIPRYMLRDSEAWHPDSFAEALEFIDALACTTPAGKHILAARAGIELALLDAYSRHFRRSISEAAGWLGLPAFGPPGSIGRIRYSGVLSGDEPGKLRSSLRKMRWFGLRDFKMKVGFPNDDERVQTVLLALGRSIHGKTTLRLDANAGWTLDQAVESLTRWSSYPIACIEQPLKCGNEQNVLLLHSVSPIPVMHDESLLTYEDAAGMIADGVMDALNIRISKNGGLMPSLKLAALARQKGLMFQLGCLVGETSILSAAGRRFLECVPGVTFAEGSYGSFLLRDDVTRRSLRFGYGGWAKPLAGYGWGVDVLPDKLQSLLNGDVIELRL